MSKRPADLTKHNVALERLEVEYVSPDSIHANDYNPNRMTDHDYELLLLSITEDGFTQPVLVGTDSAIVDGEHRWRAAQDLGMTELPIVRVPMTAAQARIATLRHNRARGREEIDLAVEVLRDLDRLGALDWAQDSLQMTDDELHRLLSDINAPEMLAAETYSTAWVPDKGGSLENVSTGVGIQSSTPAAKALAEDRSKRIESARTEEERQAAQRDRAIYRLVLTFADEEAAVVKEVLGDTPAASLLRLCHEEHARLTAAKQGDE